MSVHVLKTWPEYFEAALDGSKTFEYRRNDDRLFAVGDVLFLKEWDNEYHLDGGRYTGRELRVKVTYVLTGMGVPDGFAVLSFRREDVTP